MLNTIAQADRRRVHSVKLAVVLLARPLAGCLDSGKHELWTQRRARAREEDTHSFRKTAAAAKRSRRSEPAPPEVL